MFLILAIKIIPHTAVGRGEKSLLSKPGSEVRLSREKEKKIVRR